MNTPGRFSKCFAIALVAGMAAVAAAQQPQPTALDVSAAPDFVGEWALSMEFQGRPVQMNLTILDVDGKLAATIGSPRQPEPSVVSDATMDAGEIELTYPASFGGNDLTMILAAKIDGGKLVGTLSESNGLFSADVEGERQADEAVQMTPTDLDTTAAREYLGDWNLTFDMQGRPVEMALTIADVNGKIAAALDMPMQPEPIAIERAELGDIGLKMSYPVEFGGSALTLNLAIRINDEGGLTGTLAETSGLFSADVSGERGTTQVAAVASDGDGDGQQRRGRRGASPVARMRVDDKEINISFADLRINAPENDYEKLAGLREGNVFKFIGGRATKLRTDLSLKFGDTLIKKENVAPNYPGVYSLWLKKDEDGWKLVFNEHVDIWGTQHEAEMDVAEIPLTFETGDDIQDTFRVEIDEESSEAGTLKITWGPMVWTAKFTVEKDA